MKQLVISLMVLGCGSAPRGPVSVPTPIEVAQPAVEAPRRARRVISEASIEILDPITFVDNTAELTKESTPILEAIARTLNGNPSIVLVEVRGHSDSREDRVTRAELSVQRAEAVVAFLVARQVEPARLTAYGASDTEPLSTTNDELNRRVELVILDRD